MIDPSLASHRIEEKCPECQAPYSMTLGEMATPNGFKICPGCGVTLRFDNEEFRADLQRVSDALTKWGRLKP